MSKKILRSGLIISLMVGVVLLAGCGPNYQSCGDGLGVLIGDQCWAKKNMNVGTMVPGSQDQSLGQKYCYDNIEANCTSDGALYQWNTAMNGSTTEGAQGICPAGWHIPTDVEWHTLENHLATSSCGIGRLGWGCNPAGTALKSGGSSGFEALPVGCRYPVDAFSGRGTFTFFWCSTQSDAPFAWIRALDLGYTAVSRCDCNKAYGCSVRCLKD